MAPIRDETVDGLRDLVSKLESRVEQLEARLEQTTGGGSRRARPPNSGIRMILMGPPGAGMIWMRDCSSFLGDGLIVTLGKGTQAPKIKEKYCACHLVSLF